MPDDQIPRHVLLDGGNLNSDLFEGELGALNDTFFCAAIVILFMSLQCRLVDVENPDAGIF
jgi:hypothetical protein